MNDAVRKPEELDAQSPVKVSRWLDVHSEEFKQIDDYRPFTMKLLRMGFEDNGPQDPAWMYTDSMGRVWGHDPRDPSKPHYPLHMETQRGEVIGMRLSKKAAN
jgi:hypothetical protein